MKQQSLHPPHVSNCYSAFLARYLIFRTFSDWVGSPGQRFLQYNPEQIGSEVKNLDLIQTLDDDAADTVIVCWILLCSAIFVCDTLQNLAGSQV